MGIARGDRGRGDRLYPVLCVLVLVLLCLGLMARVDPELPGRLGIPLERSLIPPGYLDLVAVALFLLLLYAGFSRRESRRLAADLELRRDRADTIDLELAELTSLFAVSSRVSTFRRIEDALEFIAASARECLDADRASLFLVEGEELVLRAASGLCTDSLKDARIPLGEGIAGWVAQHRRPLLLNDRQDLLAFLSADRPARDIASALCVPLKGQGATLGVLNVNRARARSAGRFEDRHRKLLALYADYAAHAIENLEMYRELAAAHERLEQSLAEVRLVQDQLVQAEKMSTIGQLISEVSHELNNPLTTTVGYAQLLGRINRDPEVAEYLEVIRNEGLRCQRIIQNLLDFARKHRGEPEPVDLNRLIEKTLSLRRHQLEIDGVEIGTDLDEDLPFVVADPSRLQQVFLNLLNNAAQAIEGNGTGGQIRFLTGYDAGTGRVQARVEDDGPGIPEAQTERIFEPFYTTKEVGRGTGLGLSVCRGIVEDLRGTITAEQPPGGGARFVVSLPVGTEAATPSAPDESDEPVRSAEILVVDDDENVRRLLERTLALSGHRVATASDVEGALRQVAARGFDLILTDLVMPGGTGLDLHDRLREERPELAGRLAFVTGAALQEDVRGRVAATGRPLLHKPFRDAEVRDLVRRSLAERPTA